ncbi:MAG: hypothetical protein CVV06_09390 [Gammaproteobacteria bacterium HGW-Gammaproteobacteria-10]|nr:MAG: hypothetical protein CVV06_09390 [Gammaproteobacteria bacterium HGW-Gammaproteobacteria-10]
MKIVYSFLAFILLSAANPVQAVSIFYTLIDQGGGNYRYDYTVTNDGSLGDDFVIENFSILFDPDRYDETTLTFVSPESISVNWDELILSSGVGIPAAYDALALSEGIALGQSISGFSVQFAWLGGSLPNSQVFEIYHPETFEVINTGTTTFVAMIPIPSAGLLMLSASMVLFSLHTQKRKSV